MNKIIIGLVLVLVAIVGFVILSNAKIAGYPVVHISVNQTQESAFQNRDAETDNTTGVLGNPDNKIFGYFLFALTVLAMVIGIVFIVKSQSIGEKEVDNQNESWMLEK